MAYSNQYVKGAIGFTGSWPVIVIERARSDQPMTPVLCEVFGLEHESGSVYLHEITLTNQRGAWEAQVAQQGFDVAQRYFKEALIAAPGAAGVVPMTVAALGAYNQDVLVA
jgi:hypothetical protein